MGHKQIIVKTFLNLYQNKWEINNTMFSTNCLLTLSFGFLPLLVGVDNFNGSLLVVQRVQDFIEPGISLLLV